MDRIKKYISENKHKIPAFLINVLTFILGFLCLCFSSSISSIFVYIVAGIILALTISYLVYDLFRWKYVPFPLVDIIFSLLIICVCIWAISKPDSVMKLFVIAIGVLTIVNAIKWFISAYYKYIASFVWWQDVLIGSGEFIIGLIILFNPFKTLKVAFIAIGIYLILFSLFSIYENYKNNRKSYIDINKK